MSSLFNFEETFFNCDETIKEKLNRNNSVKQLIYDFISDLSFEQRVNFIPSLQKYFSTFSCPPSIPFNIIIFGAGGTTSWFLPKLIKIFENYYSSYIGTTITIVDGDIVEEKNLLRQNFVFTDIGKNKAKVLQERYSPITDKLSINYVDKFARYGPSSDNFISLRELLKTSHKNIIFNLVDNEGFKKQLDLYLMTRSFHYSVSYFSSGLNLYNGQVYYKELCFVKNQPMYYLDHPDFISDFEEVSLHNCANPEISEVDQLFNGNDICASILANLFQSYLNCLPSYDKVFFTCGSNISVQSSSYLYENLIFLIFNTASMYSNYFIRSNILKNCFQISPEIVRNSENYINRYGLDMKTSAAKKYYAIDDKYQQVIKFLKDIQELQSKISSL